MLLFMRMQLISIGCCIRKKTIFLEVLRYVIVYKLWIKEGDEGSKFFFNFLKKKVVVEKKIGLCRAHGSLEENPTNICSMFSDHFQNIFLASIM